MDLKLIGKTIKVKGIKQTWLADQIGVHPVTLNKFLNGKRGLAEEKLKTLLQVLEIDPRLVTKAAG